MSDALQKASLAEMSIIGAMLIDDSCVGDVLVHVKAEYFITPRMRAIFNAIQALYNAGSPVDPVLVIGRVGEEMRETVLQCMDETPTAANVLRYCEVLREQSALYRLRDLAGALSEADSLDEARDVLAKCQGLLSDRPGMRFYTISEMMAGFYKRLAGPVPEYLEWGLPYLDRNLHMPAGKYIILGARPSAGKTALALQLALHIAKKKRVGFFSLETDEPTVSDRLGASNTSVTLPQIKTHKNITLTELQIVAKEIGALSALEGNFEMGDLTAPTVNEIRTAALARRFDVIFLDYVQLVRPSTRGERTEQMQQVSMELRAMAQLTGITVVALAQLRRPDTQQKAKAATMADLKESGQFEQDADAVMLLSLVDPKDRRGDRWLVIDKNKEGEAGSVARFRFDGKKQVFTYVQSDGRAMTAKLEEHDEYIQEELPGEWK